MDNKLIAPTFKVKRNLIKEPFAKNCDAWVGMRKKVAWLKA